MAFRKKQQSHAQREFDLSLSLLCCPFCETQDVGPRALRRHIAEHSAEDLACPCMNRCVLCWEEIEHLPDYLRHVSDIHWYVIEGSALSPRMNLSWSSCCEGFQAEG